MILQGINNNLRVPEDVKSSGRGERDGEVHCQDGCIILRLIQGEEGNSS